MSSIRRLERVLNEVSSNVDPRRLRRGVPSGVLKQILRSEWHGINRDWLEKKEIIFQIGSVSNVSGTSAEDLHGARIYTSVKFNDVGEVVSVTVMLINSMGWFEKEGPDAFYTYTVNDIRRSGVIAHLFQMAEEELTAELDRSYTYLDEPRIIRRGRYWGSESRRRVGTSESRLRANRSRRQVGTSESRLRASRLRRGRLSRRVR